MSDDLRKPFYDYALAARSTADAAWVFAEWALAYMSDATPQRAYGAYSEAALSNQGRRQ